MRKLVLLVPSLLFLLTGLVAQKTTISGRVTDEKGITIPNASIKIKGSKAGAIADNDGSFTLSITPGTKLIVSAAGYKEKEVDATDNLTVTLVEENKTLSEVVVTAQGIRRRPKEIGYSVAKVSNAELTVGRAPQVAAGLSGKVSGLVIINANNSVDPAVKFNLRGYRSMSGNNDALIVVDGLPQPPGSSTMFNLLNPNDVESITVLKGGQAATLYGSQGINGAIVITMKKGQKGKMKVNFSSSYNVEKINIMAEFQDKYGSGSHYATGWTTANVANGSYKANYLDRLKDNWRSYENQQYGDAFDGSLRPAGRTLQDGSVNMLPYSPISGIREDIWNTGYTLNNQVSFSGGGENSTFFFSGENNTTEGIVPGDKAVRTGARFSAAQEYGKLKIGFSANYVQVRYDRTTFNFYNESINQAAHIPLDKYRDWRTTKFAHPNEYYNDYYTNPYFRLDNDRTKYQDANFNGTFELTYKLTPWLTAYNKFSGMNNVRSGKSTVGQFFHSTWAKSGAKVPVPWEKPGDGSGITRALTDLQGSVSDFSNTENLINNEFQFLINKEFKDFTLKSIVGINGYMRKTKNTSTSSSSIVVPNIYNVGNRRGELGGGESNTEERKYGYYADAQVGWRDKIFLHGTVRHDASSRFYKSYRDYSQYAYTYAGVDASAVITELLPVLKTDILSYIKVRAGYNKNGNDNLPLYGLDPSFGNAANFPYGNTVGISVGNTLPDADLMPEFVRTLEFGGELQFLNNKINVDFSYYTQKSEGQVLTVAIPTSTGFSNLILNVGQTKNWGYEADVKIQLLRTSKVNWDLNVRGSINENKVIKLYPGVKEFFVSGYSYGGTYVMQDQVYPMLKATSYTRDDQGRVIINTANSASQGHPITTGPLKEFGRVTPKYMLGAGTSVSFANFTLTTNWEYRGGNVMFSDLAKQMTFTGSGKWTENREPHIFPNSAYLDAGSGKYVANTTIMTREAEYGLWVDAYRNINENFVAPAWFIKMRDVNLSYSFSNNLVAKTKIFAGASIAIYGRNLIAIVDKANQFADPEFSFTTGNGIGINNTDQTPPVRQLGINLNLNFK